jgi:electron transport complex protein RnfB
MDKKQNAPDAISRRQFLGGGFRAAATATVGVGAGLATAHVDKTEQVWQLDPDKCIQCGRCETACVLTPSAVKAVHAYDLCGYCRLCGGYHHPQAKNIDSAAENQLCPSGAIKRTFVEDPFYEYTIVEERCIGCAVCVKGCDQFGNGSLFLQVRHDRCVNCNECAIARACPADAFLRVPANQPYLLKGQPDEA